MILTKEILKYNLGFEVHDMGDFWQFERGDFVLIQPKNEVIPGIKLPFIMAGKDAQTINDVHELQNLYQDLKGETLTWKK